MDERHRGPSSPNMTRGNNEVDIMVENHDSSNAARINEVQGNIQAASLWIPPWEKREPPREEQKTRPSIFRVPASLRGQSRHYRPKVVAIGPYHRDNTKLLIKDEVKRGCVNYFVSQHSLDLRTWFLDMTSKEQEARMYYSDDVSMDSHSFLEMLLLDGCFIFMAFKAMDFFIFDPKWPSNQIMHDLLMLENQIPFFVLDQLYDGIGGEQAFKKFDGRFTGTMRGYILRWLSGNTRMFRDSDLPSLPKQVVHLLHLFRLALHPRSGPINVAEQMVIDFFVCPPTVVPTATELQNQSAVKFKNREGSILDIKFRHGVMNIPFLEINDRTKIILHNLIAFEQCYYPLIEPQVTAYTEFMDCLVNKESDASLLERNGILVNGLATSKDAALFFSKLSPRTEISSRYLTNVIDDVHRHHKRTWNRWYADLKLNYFSNPWVTLSMVAAVVLLFLSFIQAYYAVISYYYHH